MYRLLMAKGKRSRGKMHVKLEFDLYLSREELAALHKEVEKHKVMQKEFGLETDWDEGSELMSVVLVHIRELKKQYSKEERNAEFKGDSDEALPVAGEIRGSKGCRQVV